jgi:hypothetical protein
MNDFIATSIQGGFSWTLTTRLGEMLRMAEAEFGERDKSYTILGIEFQESGPQIWYPGNCGNIAIQLSISAIGNVPVACYQLAHECVHLLSPQSGLSANALEEGLATVFSERYVSKSFGVQVKPDLQCYAEAAELAQELISHDPDAIKILRSEEPVISKITRDQTMSSFPSLGENLATRLCAPFERVT